MMNFRSLRIVAGLIAFVFLVTNVNPVAYAMTPKAEVSPLPAQILQVPAEFGQVTETLMGDPKAPVLIHIQSAHGNYEAEKNIENLLGYIEKNSPVKLMLLEGAANKLQPELFRIFPEHPDFNRQVTDKLMQEGYLTGPENFLINAGLGTRPSGLERTKDLDKSLVPSNGSRGESFAAYGMEDLDAYKKDREAFIKVIKADKSTQTFLRQLRADLEKRFTTKLNKDLLNLVRQEDALDSGMLSFEAWLKALGDASEKYLKQDLSDAFYQNECPYLVRYFRLRTIGSKIDEAKARVEMQDFIKELEKRGISKEIIEFFNRGLDQKQGLVVRDSYLAQNQDKSLVPSNESHATMSGSLLRRAFDLFFNEAPKDFSMKAWPNWTLYAQYTILMQEMESKGLHEETLRLTSKIEDSLAKTTEEKEYLAEARQLSLLRKLFSLELTRSEYEELRDSYLASRDSKTQSEFRVPSPELRTLFATAMDFYSAAIVRENKMFQNALQKMSAAKQQRAVVVTGGFHTEGFKKLASEKGCSYLQITPRIQEVTKHDREVYLRSILGTRDFETSQMSDVLLSDPVALQTVLRSEMRARVNDVDLTVTGLISTQSMMNQRSLFETFYGSRFRKTMQQLLASATNRPAGLYAAQQQRELVKAKALPLVAKPLPVSTYSGQHGDRQSHRSKSLAERQQEKAAKNRSETRQVDVMQSMIEAREALLNERKYNEGNHDHPARVAVETLALLLAGGDVKKVMEAYKILLDGKLYDERPFDARVQVAVDMLALLLAGGDMAKIRNAYQILETANLYGEYDDGYYDHRVEKAVDMLAVLLAAGEIEKVKSASKILEAEKFYGFHDEGHRDYRSRVAVDRLAVLLAQGDVEKLKAAYEKLKSQGSFSRGSGYFDGLAYAVYALIISSLETLKARSPQLSSAPAPLAPSEKSRSEMRWNVESVGKLRAVQILMRQLTQSGFEPRLDSLTSKAIIITTSPKKSSPFTKEPGNARILALSREVEQETNLWVRSRVRSEARSSLSTAPEGTTKNTESGKATVRAEVRLTAAEEKQLQRALKDLEPTWWDVVFAKMGAKRRAVAFEELDRLLEISEADWILLWRLINKMDAKVRRKTHLWTGDRLKELLSEIDKMTKAGQDFKVVYMPSVREQDFPGLKFIASVGPMATFPEDREVQPESIQIHTVQKNNAAINRSEVRQLTKQEKLNQEYAAWFDRATKKANALGRYVNRFDAALSILLSILLLGLGRAKVTSDDYAGQMGRLFSGLSRSFREGTISAVPEMSERTYWQQYFSRNFTWYSEKLHKMALLFLFLVPAPSSATFDEIDREGVTGEADQNTGDEKPKNRSEVRGQVTALELHDRAMARLAKLAYSSVDHEELQELLGAITKAVQYLLDSVGAEQSVDPAAIRGLLDRSGLVFEGDVLMGTVADYLEGLGKELLKTKTDRGIEGLETTELAVTGQEFYDAVLSRDFSDEMLRKGVGPTATKDQIAEIALPLKDRRVVSDEDIREVVGGSKRPELTPYFMYAYHALLDSKAATPNRSEIRGRVLKDKTLAIDVFSQAVLARLKRGGSAEIVELDVKRFIRLLSQGVSAGATISRKDLGKRIKEYKYPNLSEFLLGVFDDLSQPKTSTASRSEVREAVLVRALRESSPLFNKIYTDGNGQPTMSLIVEGTYYYLTVDRNVDRLILRKEGGVELFRVTPPGMIATRPEMFRLDWDKMTAIAAKVIEDQFFARVYVNVLVSGPKRVSAKDLREALLFLKMTEPANVKLIDDMVRKMDRAGRDHERLLSRGALHNYIEEKSFTRAEQDYAVRVFDSLVSGAYTRGEAYRSGSLQDVYEKVSGDILENVLIEGRPLKELVKVDDSDSKFVVSVTIDYALDKQGVEVPGKGLEKVRTALSYVQQRIEKGAFSARLYKGVTREESVGGEGVIPLGWKISLEFPKSPIVQAMLRERLEASAQKRSEMRGAADWKRTLSSLLKTGNSAGMASMILKFDAIVLKNPYAPETQQFVHDALTSIFQFHNQKTTNSERAGLALELAQRLNPSIVEIKQGEDGAILIDHRLRHDSEVVKDRVWGKYETHQYWERSTAGDVTLSAIDRAMQVSPVGVSQDSARAKRAEVRDADAAVTAQELRDTATVSALAIVEDSKDKTAAQGDAKAILAFADRLIRTYSRYSVITEEDIQEVANRITTREIGGESRKGLIELFLAYHRSVLEKKKAASRSEARRNHAAETVTVAELQNAINRVRVNGKLVVLSELFVDQVAMFLLEKFGQRAFNLEEMRAVLSEPSYVGGREFFTGAFEQVLQDKAARRSEVRGMTVTGEELYYAMVKLAKRYFEMETQRPGFTGKFDEYMMNMTGPFKDLLLGDTYAKREFTEREIMDLMNPRGGAVLQFAVAAFQTLVAEKNVPDASARSEVRSGEEAPKSLRLQYADWLDRAAQRADERKTQQSAETAREFLASGALVMFQDFGVRSDPLIAVQQMFSAWALVFRNLMTDDADMKQFDHPPVWRAYFSSVEGEALHSTEIIDLGLKILFEEAPPTVRSEVRVGEEAPKSLRLQYADWLDRAAKRAQEKQLQMHREAAGKPITEGAPGLNRTLSDILSGEFETLSQIQRLLKAWAQRMRTQLGDDSVTEELGQRIMWRMAFSGINATFVLRQEITELGLNILFEEAPPTNQPARSELRAMEFLRSLDVSPEDMMSFLRTYEMQMNLGLLKDGHSEGHQSLLSYAPKPTGKEKGLYWAVDFGGTNLRVIAVRFDGKGGSDRVGDPLKVRLDELDPGIFTGTAENLFARFAGLVKQHFQALKAAGLISADELQETRIAFTYSYPAKLNGRADSATAVQLVKNLKNPDLVGQDVAKLFNDALGKVFDADFQNARVLAVVNDAVGTLAAAVDPEVIAGIIMGSGHGASYAESISKIVKFDAEKQGWIAPDMMINLESADAVLPGSVSFLTEIDRVMFAEENPLGQRPYEKLIGGMYLPEFFRRYLKHFVEQGELFNGKMPEALRSSWTQEAAVDPEILTRMQRGDGRDAARETARLLRIHGPSSTDLDILIATVKAIYQRAAYLSAVELMALALRASPGLDRHVKIAIDGSLFEHSTSFRGWLTEALEVLAEARLGDKAKAKNIELKLVKDGSGLGAAMIAATLDAAQRSEMREEKKGEADIRGGVLTADALEFILGKFLTKARAKHFGSLLARGSFNIVKPKGTTKVPFVGAVVEYAPVLSFSPPNPNTVNDPRDVNDPALVTDFEVVADSEMNDGLKMADASQRETPFEYHPDDDTIQAVTETLKEAKRLVEAKFPNYMGIITGTNVSNPKGGAPSREGQHTLLVLRFLKREISARQPKVSPAKVPEVQAEAAPAVVVAVDQPDLSEVSQEASDVELEPAVSEAQPTVPAGRLYVAAVAQAKKDGLSQTIDRIAHDMLTSLGGSRAQVNKKQLREFIGSLEKSQSERESVERFFIEVFEGLTVQAARSEARQADRADLTVTQKRNGTKVFKEMEAFLRPLIEEGNRKIFPAAEGQFIVVGSKERQSNVPTIPDVHAYVHHAKTGDGRFERNEEKYQEAQRFLREILSKFEVRFPGYSGRTLERFVPDHRSAPPQTRIFLQIFREKGSSQRSEMRMKLSSPVLGRSERSMTFEEGGDKARTWGFKSVLLTVLGSFLQSEKDKQPNLADLKRFLGAIPDSPMGELDLDIRQDAQGQYWLKGIEGWDDKSSRSVSFSADKTFTIDGKANKAIWPFDIRLEMSVDLSKRNILIRSLEAVRRSEARRGLANGIQELTNVWNDFGGYGAFTGDLQLSEDFLSAYGGVLGKFRSLDHVLRKETDAAGFSKLLDRTIQGLELQSEGVRDTGSRRAMNASIKKLQKIQRLLSTHHSFSPLMSDFLRNLNILAQNNLQQEKAEQDLLEIEAQALTRIRPLLRSYLALSDQVLARIQADEKLKALLGSYSQEIQRKFQEIRVRLGIETVDVLETVRRAEVRNAPLTVEDLQKILRDFLADANRAVFPEGEGIFKIVTPKTGAPYVSSVFKHVRNGNGKIEEPVAKRLEVEAIMRVAMEQVAGQYLNYSGVFTDKVVPFDLAANSQGKASGYTRMVLKFSEKQAPSQRSEARTSLGTESGAATVRAEVREDPGTGEVLDRAKLDTFLYRPYSISTPKGMTTRLQGFSGAYRGDGLDIQKKDNGYVLEFRGFERLLPKDAEAIQKMVVASFPGYQVEHHKKDGATTDVTGRVWWTLEITKSVQRSEIRDAGEFVRDALLNFWHSYSGEIMVGAVVASVIGVLATVMYQSQKRQGKLSHYPEAVKLIKEVLVQHVGAALTAFSIEMSNRKLFAIQQILARGHVPELRLINAGNEVRISWRAPSGEKKSWQASIEIVPPSAAGRSETREVPEADAVLRFEDLGKILSQPYSFVTKSGTVTRIHGFSGVYQGLDFHFRSIPGGFDISYRGSPVYVQKDAEALRRILNERFPDYEVVDSSPSQEPEVHEGKIYWNVTIVRKSSQRSEARLTKYLSKPDLQGTYTVPFQAVYVESVSRREQLTDQDFDQIVERLRYDETLRQVFGDKLQEVANSYGWAFDRYKKDISGEFRMANMGSRVVVTLRASKEGQGAQVSVKVPEVNGQLRAVVAFLEAVYTFFEENTGDAVQQPGTSGRSEVREEQTPDHRFQVEVIQKSQDRSGGIGDAISGIFILGVFFALHVVVWKMGWKDMYDHGFFRLGHWRGILDYAARVSIFLGILGGTLLLSVFDINFVRIFIDVLKSENAGKTSPPNGATITKEQETITPEGPDVRSEVRGDQTLKLLPIGRFEVKAVAEAGMVGALASGAKIEIAEGEGSREVGELLGLQGNPEIKADAVEEAGHIPEPTTSLRSEVRAEAAVLPAFDMSLALSKLDSVKVKWTAYMETAKQVTGGILAVATVMVKESWTKIVSVLFQEHLAAAPELPENFASGLSMFRQIVEHVSAENAGRLVIDERLGAPDAASVLPLVVFARYNPKVEVVLALIANIQDVQALTRELAQKGALPKNFKALGFTTEDSFVRQFARIYNSAAPAGKSVALVTDRIDSVVTQKIGMMKSLLSVVGGSEPLKQTASTLLAADKLLDSSIMSKGYHFIAVEKLGGLATLMAELTNYLAAQAHVKASA